MTMPVDLLLVRHGESEGNVAKEKSEKGDHSLYTQEFLARHSSEWRLTDYGIWQAKMAGLWICANIPTQFQRYYISECYRAIETAENLDLPNARWFTEFYLNERNWGFLDSMSQEEREKLYAKDIERWGRDHIYWAPPGYGSENMVDVALRSYERIVSTLHRECSDGAAIIVCHGEVMWAWRMRLERMPIQRYRELHKSKDKKDRLANCQILHYTRRNPKTGEIAPYLNWMRSVCPWDMSRSRNEWENIVRPSYNNEELKAMIGQFPLRLINHTKLE